MERIQSGILRGWCAARKHVLHVIKLTAAPVQNVNFIEHSTPSLPERTTNLDLFDRVWECADTSELCTKRDGLDKGSVQRGGSGKTQAAP